MTTDYVLSISYDRDAAAPDDWRLVSFADQQVSTYVIGLDASGAPIACESIARKLRQGLAYFLTLTDGKWGMHTHGKLDGLIICDRPRRLMPTTREGREGHALRFLESLHWWTTGEVFMFFMVKGEEIIGRDDHLYGPASLRRSVDTLIMKHTTHQHVTICGLACNAYEGKS